MDFVGADRFVRVRERDTSWACCHTTIVSTRSFVIPFPAGKGHQSGENRGELDLQNSSKLVPEQQEYTSLHTENDQRSTQGSDESLETNTLSRLTGALAGVIRRHGAMSTSTCIPMSKRGGGIEAGL